MKAVTPYERGVSACRRGKLLRDNPFSHKTQAQSQNYWQWAEGYCAQAKKEAADAKARAFA
jgi:hypothetical protein